MSKELEALQKLRDLVENLTRIDYVPTALRNEVKVLLIKSYEDSNEYFSQIEEALNELECAKHNYRAVKEIYNNAVDYSIKIQNELNNELNELKKRNEPMKPLFKDMGYEHYDIYCPSCKEYIGFRNSVRESLTFKYCPDCGQALD